MSSQAAESVHAGDRMARDLEGFAQIGDTRRELSTENTHMVPKTPNTHFLS